MNKISKTEHHKKFKANNKRDLIRYNFCTILVCILLLLQKFIKATSMLTFRCSLKILKGKVHAKSKIFP